MKYGDLEIHGSDKFIIGCFDPRETVIDAANAAFIVRACNSHDALVEALENLLNANPAFRSMPLGSPGSVARIAQEMSIEAEDAAKAALALAKGE